LPPSQAVLLEIFASIIGMTLNTSLCLDRTLQQNNQFRASLGLTKEFPEIVGNSKPILDLLKSLHRLLDSDLPVLITGETGTGKELVARVLHFCGKRKNGRFVAVNCSALTESLLESELFGHEKGSFTGATGLRRGLFEEANNGTLFLDEIGDMPHSLQAKFLRVLHDGEFRRVGGNATLGTNARIILATNRNLVERVKERQFREDLYYRIHVAQIPLPPLRDRKEDIPLLASYFLRAAVAQTGKKVRGLSPEALEMLKEYSWPGNVRQLKGEIERIVAFTEDEWILASDLDTQIAEPNLEPQVQKMEDASTLKEMERAAILSRLEACNWNIVLAARSLGVTRNGLYSKMKLYNISRNPPTLAP
jgi:DNA-binding NtrC family response regulator